MEAVMREVAELGKDFVGKALRRPDDMLRFPRCALQDPYTSTVRSGSDPCPECRALCHELLEAFQSSEVNCAGEFAEFGDFVFAELVVHVSLWCSSRGFGQTGVEFHRTVRRS